MIKKPVIVLLLTVLISLSLMGACPKPEKGLSYDPEAALDFAKDYVFWSSWGNCAEYASRCLEAGGMSDIFSLGCTTFFGKLSQFPELTTYALEFDRHFNIPMGELESVLTPGDIGIYVCSNCQKYIGEPYVHTFVYYGTDPDGYLLAYSHNPCLDPRNAYWYDKTCYGCGAVLHNIIFFHFPKPQGWVKPRDGWVFFDETGQRADGILKIDEKYHLFDGNGHPLSGWNLCEGGYAFCEADGEIRLRYAAPFGIPLIFDDQGRCLPASLFPQKELQYPAP